MRIKHSILIAAFAAIAILVSVDAANADWPWWRGPNHDGSAAEGASLPKNWNAEQGVRWRVPIPGRGHGSPTIVGDQVILTSADEQAQIQAVHCFDRATGKEVWKTEVHRGNLMLKGGNKKATQASSSVACDGERLFVNFLNNGAMFTTALSRAGEKLWQAKISDYKVHQGFGSSPFIYESLVLVSADNKGGGAIAGLDRESGETIWRHERVKDPNYSSPVVVHADGRDQLIFTGLDKVCSFEPLTGKPLWTHEGATTECVTTTVTDGKVVVSTGGYPKNHVAAMKADGSGDIVWENGTRVYVPSMLIRDGYLYAVADNGVAICWEASTGKEMWKERLGGTFTSSPIRVGNQILAVNESGEWFSYQAEPTSPGKVAKWKLGDEVFATPSIAGDTLFARVAIREEGNRQEYLYAIDGK